MTTNAFDGKRSRCPVARIDNYVSKPFQRERLRAMLARWIEHAAGRSTGTPMLNDQLDAGQAEREVIDRRALDTIRSLQSDAAPDLLMQVVRIYLESAPALIARLRDGFATLDHDVIRTAAHTLKSSSANVGANALAQLCKKLELAARAGSFGPEVPSLSEIENAYGAVHRALESELEGAR